MYSFEGRIRYSECDETGRLTPFSLVNYLQDCSSFQSASMGGGIDGLEGRGLAWVLAAWRIEVDRLPAFGEGVVARTWCHEMTRAHALRNFTLETGGRAVVRADSQWLVYDVARRRATRVPEDQHCFVEDAPALDMGPLARRLVAHGEGEQAPDIVVSHRDLDTNHHVNNARYVAFALDAIEAVGATCPEPPFDLQVQYRSMAFLGDSVRPRVSPLDGGLDVDLTGDEGATLAFVRIQNRKDAA